MARKKKIEMLESIDGHRIVYPWDGFPWMHLKIVRRKSEYFVRTIEEGIYLVKERRRDESKKFMYRSYEVAICLSDGRVYLEKLEPHERVFFTRSLDDLLDGALAVGVWIKGEWKLGPVPKKKKEEKEEEKAVQSEA
jgi:hypothetical protein